MKKGFDIGEPVIAYGNSESSYCGVIIGRRRNGYYKISVVDESETIVLIEHAKFLELDKKQIIKDLLVKCTPEQQAMFKRMYGSVKEELHNVVDSIKPDISLDFVIKQCERTIQKNWDNKPLLRDQRLDDLLG
jgi:hypothetical protein